MKTTFEANCAPCSEGEIHPTHDSGAPVVVHEVKDHWADPETDPRMETLEVTEWMKNGKHQIDQPAR